MTQEAISLISIMIGVIILTAWVMWLLLRKSGDDLSMQFERDAAKEQLTRGVMHINVLENENRLLKKVLHDLNEKGVVEAGELEAGFSQSNMNDSRPATAPTKNETLTPVGAVARPRTEDAPKPQPPAHTLESSLRQLEIDALDRGIPPVGAVPSPRKKAAPKPPSPQPPQNDDLTKIKGIGPKLAGKLNKLGITRFQQITALKNEDLEKLNDALGMIKGRIQHLKWREQAWVLAGRNKAKV